MKDFNAILATVGGNKERQRAEYVLFVASCSISYRINSINDALPKRESNRQLIINKGVQNLCNTTIDFGSVISQSILNGATITHSVTEQTSLQVTKTNIL